ncbi:MAG TPA: sigma-54 dependent transcriptional regulator [Planctomycetia bacterium]|nr:sigma-54 dependent transcriptional regulator [Planctomycetia bacterium]
MGKRKPRIDRVLVADDDAAVRKVLDHLLRAAGYETVLAADGQEALDRADDQIALALLDLRMPKVGGMECLRRLRKRYADLPILITSEFGEIRDAVEAVKSGATTFLEKPIDPDQLRNQIVQALHPARLATENRELKQTFVAPAAADLFAAVSPAAGQLLDRARKLAPLDGTILLTGESGTGKTTLARLIHQASGRPDDRFIPVSCATLPANLMESQLFGHVRGAFTDAVADRAGSVEAADGGTLFLDEIGDLPLELQPKLLTFLQEKSFQRIGDPRPRQVDVRVIAATNHDLEAKVADRSFREDLFYRLNVLPLFVPPLRDRAADILPFANFCLRRLAQKRNAAVVGLSPEAEAVLVRYAWPGNLRELESKLEQAATFCSESRITEADLSIRLAGVRPPVAALGLAGLTLEEIERRALVETIDYCKGNKKAAARMLAIDEKSVYNKMRRLGLIKDERAGGDPPL